MPSAKERARQEEQIALREAARRGDVRAQCRIGEMHARGEGDCPQDAAEAARWFRRAAELGDKSAQHQLGDLLARKLSLGKKGTDEADRNLTLAEDCEVEAAVWWRAAALQGHVGAQHSLACSLIEGKLRDPQEAVRWWRAAASQGHAEAQHKLALCMKEGIGTARNVAEAASWLQKAAEQGVADAQCDLGKALTEGWTLGLEKDETLAIKWLQKAAKQGSTDAMCQLGALASSNDDAINWFKKAAKRGNADAMCRLGALALSDDDARAWYDKAAACGLPQAQHWVALRQLEAGNAHAAASGLAQAAQSGWEPALATLAEHAHVREIASFCCVGCGATRRLHACNECEVARFCGKACRQRMWPSHKESCKEWRGA